MYGRPNPCSKQDIVKLLVLNYQLLFQQTNPSSWIRKNEFLKDYLG